MLKIVGLTTQSNGKVNWSDNHNVVLSIFGLTPPSNATYEQMLTCILKQYKSVWKSICKLPTAKVGIK